MIMIIRHDYLSEFTNHNKATKLVCCFYWISDDLVSDVATVSNVRQDLSEWQQKHANLVLTTVKVSTHFLHKQKHKWKFWTWWFKTGSFKVEIWFMPKTHERWKILEDIFYPCEHSCIPVCDCFYLGISIMYIFNVMLNDISLMLYIGMKESL